jgi:hypothetical protein
MTLLNPFRTARTQQQPSQQAQAGNADLCLSRRQYGLANASVVNPMGKVETLDSMEVPVLSNEAASGTGHGWLEAPRRNTVDFGGTAERRGGSRDGFVWHGGCWSSGMPTKRWALSGTVLATGLGFIVALATTKGGLRPPLSDFLARHQLRPFLTTYCFARDHALHAGEPPLTNGEQ